MAVICASTCETSASNAQAIALNRMYAIVGGVSVPACDPARSVYVGAAMSTRRVRAPPRTMLAAMRVWRVAIGALIAGLCLAAVAAITALVSGDFDDTHARVIASSLGFGVFSALGAAGAELWRDARGWRHVLGGATAAAAFLAYALLIAALWLSDDDDAAWRAFGIAGLVALWGSHASLVLRARRRDDASLVTALVWISIVGGAFDMLVADAALVELVDELEEGHVRLTAAVLVAVILATALPPLIRRFWGPQAAPSREDRGLSVADLADELTAAASRLDAAGFPADVRREAASLRELAARARR